MIEKIIFYFYIILLITNIYMFFILYVKPKLNKKLNLNTEGHRKLLDMIYGWSFFVSEFNQEEEFEIANLYQEAGNIEKPTNENIKKFIKVKIIPFLLRK